MLDGGPLFRPGDIAVLARHLWRRLNRLRLDAGSDISENLRDRVEQFSEYPDCELCGSSRSREVTIARDGSFDVTKVTGAVVGVRGA